MEYPKNVREIKNVYDSMYDVTFVPMGCVFWENRLLLKIMHLFTFDGLPKSMNEKALVTSLFKNGFCGVVNDDNYGLVNVEGSLYGISVYPNWYPYFTISNPLILGINKTIGADCEIIYLNSTHTGIYDLIARYARLLADSDSTYASQLYILRRPNFLNAPDEKTGNNIKSAMQINRLGMDTVILGKDLLNETSTLSMTQTVNTNILTEMLNARNNIYNMFLREIGIKCVDEKKERMITDETDISNQLLAVSIFDMLENINDSLQNVNKLYDTNIVCKISKEWEYLLGQLEETKAEPKEDPKDEPKEEREEKNNDNRGILQK